MSEIDELPAAPARAPIIGITTYGREIQRRFRLSVDYVDAVRRAGGIAVLLPPGDPRQRQWLDHLDGIILSGGGDVDPHHYRGPNHDTLRGMDAERDASELSLIPPLLDSGLPCLLICRGAQLLNVALGGTLHSHLPEAYGASLAHRAMAAEAGETTHVLHEVELLPQTLLASLLGVERATVASWHHQAPAEVAPGLVVSAQAPDGVIEAIEMPGHPWLLGVQWHPEITAGHDPLQQRIFDSLVDAARQGS